jgi:hypothetical protein
MNLVRSASIAVVAALSGAAEPQDVLPFRIDGEGPPTIAWGRRFATANDDWINDLVLLRNGHVMAVGFLNRKDGTPPSDWHALAAELGQDGMEIAQRSYGASGGIDAFWSVAEAGDRNRIFAGFTTRIGGGGIDGLALLTAANGELRAERAFGAAGYDRFTDVTAVPDGYVLLGHSQPAGSDKRKIFIVKIDLDGRPQWQRIHDAAESWGALYIEPAGDGGFIIAGGMTAGDDDEMFAMKVDADGRESWRKRAGTPQWDEVNHGLVVRPDGRIVLVGYTHKRGEEANDLVSATLTTAGEVERIERFGGVADDRAILAKADAAGRIWIVGQTASAGAGGTDLLLSRLDAGGSFDDAAITIGGPADDNGTAVLPLADGSLMLAGYSRGLGGGGQDAFVLRLGAPQWGKPHPGFRRQVVTAPRRAD